MTVNLRIYVIPVLICLSFSFGCRKYEEINPDPEKQAFDFKVTESQRVYINESRDEQYEITDPVPELLLGGEIYSVDRLEIRGDNTLNFYRKGFSVNMGRKLTFYNPWNQTERKYEEFKLLAMVYDFTYIENSTATGLFRKVSLWPVFSFFTEVKLNGHTQGLYHFIEDPVEYFIEEENSSCVIRRGYDHVVKSFGMNPSSPLIAQNYFDRFDKIYSDLPLYTGQQAFDTLSSRIDLEQYFTKLSIDLLIKNGDYTDEVFFYTKTRNGKEIFGVFPWDYDDIFSDQPHEIGNWWATGSVFGDREYYSIEDVIADVGVKLLYSIEDDLDYKIAKDGFLYQKYLETLRSVIGKLTPQVIDEIFDYTNAHIGPFYQNDSIIAQSRYDVDQTNYNLFVSNLASKRDMLKERRDWILGELDKQQKSLK